LTPGPLKSRVAGDPLCGPYGSANRRRRGEGGGADRLRPVTVRLDKWLQVARAFKTRSGATKACSQRRVKVNGIAAKAHRNLALDDRVEIDFRDWQRVLVVKELRDRTLPKKEAARIYEDLSEPRPAADPMDKFHRLAGVVRERGSGRPTKRQRRDQERFKGR